MGQDFQSSEDYSASSSISAVQLMNLVRGMQPVDGIGMILIRSSAPTLLDPDTTTNPRYKNYICCDTVNNKLYVYDVAQPTHWKEVGSIAVNSASQITNGIITLVKLDQDGATTNQVIAWNGTRWAKANTIDTIANNSFAISKLDNAGAEGSTLQTVGGAKVWTTIANLATSVLANISSFDIAKLSGKVNKGLLATDSSGVASWQTWATFFDTYTDNLIIKLAKLAQDSATALQVITWDGTKWAAATPILTKYYDSPNGGALQAAGVEYSFNVTSTFGNGVIPKLVRPVVYCLADDGTTGFKAGDELEMHSFCNSAATSNKAFFTTRMNVSGSTVTITVAFLGTTALATALQAIKPGTPNTMVDLDLTKWSVRLRAFN